MIQYSVIIQLYYVYFIFSRMMSQSNHLVLFIYYSFMYGAVLQVNMIKVDYSYIYAMYERFVALCSFENVIS